jgi:hypothetical protein
MGLPKEVNFMTNLIIQEELEIALQEDFHMYINGTRYDVTPHFSTAGKEGILDQLLKLLCTQEQNGNFAS